MPRNTHHIHPHDATLVPTAKLTTHPDNPRQGDIGAITESIRHNGWYGAVIAQKSTGHVLAGNHRLQAAKALGITHVPVTYLDVTDEQARRILIADNRTSDLASYNSEQLANILESLAQDGGLDGTGYDGDDLDALLTDLEQGDEPASAKDARATRKVQAPTYEPTGEKPKTADLYDDTRTRALLQDINSAHDLPPDIAAFLASAAYRHTVFDYQSIAEYYAHADPHVQRLMEQSALVIIDFDQAIEQGYVTLIHKLGELYRVDHGEDEAEDAASADSALGVQ